MTRIPHWVWRSPAAVIIFLLWCVCLRRYAVAFSEAEYPTDTFRVGVQLISMNGESFAAVKMAFHEWASDFSNTFGVNISFSVYQPSGREAIGNYYYTQHIFSLESSRDAFANADPAKRVRLLIGPIYAEETTIMSAASVQSHVPILSFANPVINKRIYPFTMQMGTDDQNQAIVLARICKHFGWKRVALLAASSSEVNDFVRAFIEYAPSYDISPTLAMAPGGLSANLTVYDITPQLDLIKGSGAYIILLAATELEADGFLNQLTQNGMNRSFAPCVVR
eukprot:TRINITY_DN557_c0_g1_i2.p1 TRINITY_DN557_c0_g1~~TRINITY_DN557_c0_g1_i2.p1  ORF type:complete len:280 (-),score=35.33 TRINITY_DN557_c0_g1_i2:118-957(-)